MSPRLLDLFCGAGGAAMGYHRAGFEVFGVDILPQPRYPFPFIQADALFPPVRLSEFDAIHASPPCQAYSRLRHLPWLKGREYPALIDATRAMLQEAGVPWVIENVEDAPLRNGLNLCGMMLGLPLTRHRRFESSVLLLQPPHQKHTEVMAPGGASLAKRYTGHGVTGVLVKEINRESFAGHFAGVDRARAGTRHRLDEAGRNEPGCPSRLHGVHRRAVDGGAGCLTEPSPWVEYRLRLPSRRGGDFVIRYTVARQVKGKERWTPPRKLKRSTNVLFRRAKKHGAPVTVSRLHVENKHPHKFTSFQAAKEHLRDRVRHIKEAGPLFVVDCADGKRFLFRVVEVQPPVELPAQAVHWPQAQKDVYVHIVPTYKGVIYLGTCVCRDNRLQPGKKSDHACCQASDWRPRNTIFGNTDKKQGDAIYESTKKLLGERHNYTSWCGIKYRTECSSGLHDWHLHISTGSCTKCYPGAA
jgi:DNA (cytosine-5)-methyltransferase 1